MTEKRNARRCLRDEEMRDAGRYLRVIYIPDPEPESVFVITAFELTGKPLTAYNRRRRKKK
ncbi:MAG: hypothetical protein Q8N82_00995 [Deltaproteobacteria bacterium]|nr:hypothetical protein [Deltaproteobacteria bacterium]